MELVPFLIRKLEKVSGIFSVMFKRMTPHGRPGTCCSGNATGEQRGAYSRVPGYPSL
jgi:hypothetical protein